MDTRITRALDYIEQHLDTRLTIDTLAVATNLSPSRFAHLFREAIGTSPAQYVHVLRMLRARVLLERTSLSVKEVMALVGCHDPSHFSRDFRWFHGVAPRQCRLAAAREARVEQSATPDSETGATLARIVALANELRSRTRKPRPRARAPDGAPSIRSDHEEVQIVNEPGGGSVMSRISLLLVAIVGLVLSTAAPANAQIGAANTITVPIVSTGTAAVFNGTFTLQRFVATTDGVAAVGLLNGVVTATGGTATSIVRTVTVPAQVSMQDALSAAQIGPTACGILHLDLGPLFLDVLGLQVDLSRVVLDIAAQPGAGNLLGNLLCAVTGLLDSPGGLARLLNQILGILA